MHSLNNPIPNHQFYTFGQFYAYICVLLKRFWQSDENQGFLSLSSDFPRKTDVLANLVYPNHTGIFRPKV